MTDRRLLVTILLATAGCGGSPAAPTPAPSQPPVLRLPETMRLTATAEGRAGDAAISCALDFVVSVQPDGDAMRGSMGGEARRTRLLPDGSGEEFWADAHYPQIRITVDGGGRARLQSYRNGVPDTGEGSSRFWDRLTSFEGVHDDRRNAIAGTWTCLPLDVRSDVSGEAAGTWTLQPR